MREVTQEQLDRLRGGEEMMQNRKETGNIMGIDGERVLFLDGVIAIAGAETLAKSLQEDHTKYEVMAHACVAIRDASEQNNLSAVELAYVAFQLGAFTESTKGRESAQVAAAASKFFNSLKKNFRNENSNKD